jgi:hypothetical protein
MRDLVTCPATRSMPWSTAGSRTPVIGLRYGEIRAWAFAAEHGGGQAELGPQPPVSPGGAHVFPWEVDEENGTSVPPRSSYLHDDGSCAPSVSTWTAHGNTTA